MIKPDQNACVFMVTKEHSSIESCENTWKTIPVNKKVFLDHNPPQKGFFWAKNKKKNAHNFLILVGGFEKFKVLQKAYLEHIKNIALILGRGVRLGSVGLP